MAGESVVQTRDLTRTTLSVLFIAAFILGSFWVVRPFFFAFVWATLIVIPTWPFMLELRDRLGGRRALAVAILTGTLLLVVVIPFWLALSSLVENRDVAVSWVRSIAEEGLPPPPEWLRDVPLAGERVSERWEELALADRRDLAQRVAPYVQTVAAWLFSQIGGAGVLFIHFLMTLAFTVLLLFQGENFARGLRRFARRLGGDRGELATILAGQAIRAVAMGVIVTALVQAALAGVAFLIVGLPYALLLSGLVLVLAVLQLGAGPVLIPCIIWLYWSGQVGWGTVFLVMSIFIMSIDNVLRPLLIKRGANLPLLLIFIGVIGGLISFGIIGLFIGPVVLAISYTLLDAWVNEIQHPQESVTAAG